MVLTLSRTSWRQENLPVDGEASEYVPRSTLDGTTGCIYTLPLPYVKRDFRAAILKKTGAHPDGRLSLMRMEKMGIRRLAVAMAGAPDRC
jgi:hypothetical protein